MTNSPAADGAGTQYVCVAGSVAGNDYTPVLATHVTLTLTLTNDAVLTWLWTTNYWLETTSGPNGSVNVGSGWLPGGVTTQIAATADMYYHFTNWSGSVSSSDNPLNLLMDSPQSVQANFAENTAGKGTPEWWLAQHGWISDFDAAETNDPDGDLMPTWQEFVANTIPTNGESRLEFRWGSDSVAAAGYLLTWTSATNRLYDISWRTNLVDAPADLFTDLPATPPLNRYTDTVHSMEQAIYYRIRVHE